MSNVGIVRNTLTNLGWDPMWVNGMVGRLQQESGMDLNPMARNPGDGSDGSDSIGIAQWNGDRANGLRTFAAANDADWNDPVIQARYIDHEMRTNEGNAWRMMQSAKTLEDAAAAAMSYERPAGWTADNPRAGHGWDNTVRNAQALAGMPASSGGTAPTRGLSLGSTPGQVAGTSTPASVSTNTPAPAKEPSRVDMALNKVLGEDIAGKLKEGFSAEAGKDNPIANGAALLKQGLQKNEGPDTSINSGLGAASMQADAQRAAAAAQMMQQLTQKKKPTFGLGLGVMG